MAFVFSALLALALLAPVTAMAQAAQSRLRVMHDSPDAGTVDVFVDGERAFQNVPYSTTTDYQSVPPGQHRVQVAPAGKSANKSVIDVTIDLRRGTPYTVLALGKLANIKGQLLADTNKVPPAGNARVRIVHAAAGVGPVDVYPSGSETPVLTSQYFGSADYINIPAGTYAFDVKLAGSSETVLTSQQLRFEAGWVYSLVVTQPTTGDAKPLVRASVDRIAPT